MSSPELKRTAEECLAVGELCVVKRMHWGSNATYLVEILDSGSGQERRCLGVYKPASGERPLWDFEEGTLCRREVAAYRFSELLGWDLVPPTVLRDGPLGIGSVQQYVEADPEEHYFTLGEEMTPMLRKIVAFDVAVNNADRKSGHVLVDSGGRLRSIDHGTCFHVIPKLRSVIWEFSGEPIDEEILEVLEPLGIEGERFHELERDLSPFLSDEEVDAVGQRVQSLVASGRFPRPAGDRSLPWPMI